MSRLRLPLAPVGLVALAAAPRASAAPLYLQGLDALAA